MKNSQHFQFSCQNRWFFINCEYDNDYTAVDTFIERMNLTQGEYDVLCAYMSGLTYLEVTNLLNVNRTTVWRRRVCLQKKYMFLR